MIERKTVWAALMLSTLLTIFGLGGVWLSSATFSAGALPEDPTSLLDDNVEIDGNTALQLQLLYTQVQSPLLRPIVAVNIVISALLVIGSFLLTWRRPQAPWWIRQIVAAKTLWFIVYGAVLVHEFQREDFSPLPLLNDVELPGGEASGDLATSLMIGALLGTVVKMIAHVGIAWRVSRPDIAALIESRNSRDA